MYDVHGNPLHDRAVWQAPVFDFSNDTVNEVTTDPAVTCDG
jgi:hypothetical protein